MLEIIKAILFGVVEGITEWLPVSSTGHMILLDTWKKKLIYLKNDRKGRNASKYNKIFITYVYYINVFKSFVYVIWYYHIIIFFYICHFKYSFILYFISVLLSLYT